MLFAPDWKRDTELQSEGEPPVERAMFARWALELAARGALPEALDRAHAGTEEFPDYATGWFVLARVQQALGQCQDAVISAERCLSLEPSFFAAWELLAGLLDGLRRPTAAGAARARHRELLGAFAAAVEEPKAASPAGVDPARLILKRPREVTRVFETPTLAEVYRRQGLLDRALEVYNRILNRHPEDAGARAMVEKLKQELSARRRPAEHTS